MLVLNQKFGKNFFIFTSIIFIFTGLIQLQKKYLSQLSALEDKTDYHKKEEHLKNTLKFQQKISAFGFDNLIADWNYLQFLQYFGDTEAREVTGYSLVTDYFEVAVDKDPRFTQSFLSFSAANSLFAAQPKKTVELLDRVLKFSSPNLPGYPFFLWTYKATDEILFLGDLEAAKNSYEIAAEWASMRNDDIGKEMASRFLTTAKFLASNPDSTDAQIAAWVNVLNQAQDLKTQQHVIKQLEELGAEVSITEEGKINITRPEKV